MIRMIVDTIQENGNDEMIRRSVDQVWTAARGVTPLEVVGGRVDKTEFIQRAVKAIIALRTIAYVGGCYDELRDAEYDIEQRYFDDKMAASAANAAPPIQEVHDESPEDTFEAPAETMNDDYEYFKVFPAEDTDEQTDGCDE